MLDVVRGRPLSCQLFTELEAGAVSADADSIRRQSENLGNLSRGKLIPREHLNDLAVNG